MAELSIETRLTGALPVIDLAGELDVYQAPRLREKLEALIADGHPRLVLNLTRVEYIDSTGLGTLVAVRKLAMTQGGEVRLLCPNPAVRRVFEITGLLPVFSFFEEESAALTIAGADR